MSHTLADRLAAYAAGVRYENLPGAVAHEVKRRLIDSLACAFGAMGADAPSIARRVALRVRSEQPASLIGGGASSPELAAFANGVLVRYLDYNDTYLSLEPAHPSDNLPAVLAVAEAAGAGGHDVLVAATIAYELQCRLCDAASIRSRGWDHVTYGSLSTALAASKLLGLDEPRTVHALGLAGVSGMALRQTRAGELSMWKGCAFAQAARQGVFAALLAADGMTGPAPIFEGSMGFEKLVSGPLEIDRLGGGDVPFMVLQTYIKFWPAEYHSQSAIDSALRLRPQIGDPAQIDRIDIDTFDACADIIGSDPEKWRPKTRETADHSLPYCVAVALVDGQVDLAQFEPARFTDPSLLALVGRIQVHRDATLTARYPAGIPNRLRIRLRGGRELVDECEFPRGHARNPMSDAEVEAKFRRLAARHCEPGRQREILDTVWRLESLQSMRRLMNLLECPMSS
jgi:2-methylcitrate dehydratase